MLTTLDLLKMKQDGKKITMITAYDFPSAKQVEAAHADMLLVGDSLGMVVLGYSSTTKVTMADMIHHAKAAKRGAPNTFTVVDMPFMSYYASLEKSVENATKLFQETNAQALKMEGASEEVLSLIKRLAAGGIPVVAHLGLTPQTVNVLGGYKVQANDEEEVQQLIHDTHKVVEAGAVALVLECIPKELGKLVSESISIPTIGIGAGPNCDGQVLVYHDILQYGPTKFPKFVKNYADFNEIGVDSLKKYVHEVKEGVFPQKEHSYTIKSETFLPN